MIPAEKRQRASGTRGGPIYRERIQEMVIGRASRVGVYIFPHI